MKMKCVFLILGLLSNLSFLKAAEPLGNESGAQSFSLGEQLELLQGHERSAQWDNADKIPAGKLTLSDAFAATLLSSPKLAQYDWSIRVAEAESLQARLLPNPEIEFEMEEFGGSDETSGVDSAESTLLFSQLVELGKKREKRTDVARIKQNIALWDYEATRTSILAQVSKAFATVLAAQKRFELVQLNLDLAQQALFAAKKRVQAGAASPLEQAKAQTIVTSEEIKLHRSQRELGRVRLELAALWGSKSPEFTKVDGSFLFYKRLPKIDSLYDYIDQHPDVARWADEVARRQAMIRLEQSNAVTDLTLGVGVKHMNESDDLSAVIQISMPLPLFDRNQGRILKARHELEKSREEKREAEVHIYTSLEKSYRQLASIHEEVTAIRDGLIVTAQRVYEDMDTAYREGKVSLLDVVDAQRMLFDARSRLIESQASYHHIAIDIEALIGQSLLTIEGD